MQTLDLTIVGADGSTELWWPPIGCKFLEPKVGYVRTVFESQYTGQFFLFVEWLLSFLLLKKCLAKSAKQFKATVI